MKTTPISPRDIRASVLSVPPLARNPDLTINADANRKLVAYLRAGGVKTFMYGGNANLYNIAISEYGKFLDLMSEIAGADDWVIPSAGPDYGRLMDQAALLKNTRFPTAMALPMQAPATPEGNAKALSLFAEKMGKPIICYIKFDGYLEPDAVGKMFDAGIIAAIKYAIVRPDPLKDDYLRRLIDRVGVERIISGMGERPAIVHLRDFALQSFTSGSVCVAPRQSMALLAALNAKNYPLAEQIRARFIPLEDLRDGINPIRVLHDAVTLAGIADMGPLLPTLSGLEAKHRGPVETAAKALAATERTAQAAE